MKVRLKRLPSSLMSTPTYSFNSMKVRLKHKHEANKRDNGMFQFHEGPIKTRKICT